MTTVKFLMDYRGKLTKEQFYQQGQTAKVEDTAAAELVRRGRAELVPVATKAAETPKGKKPHE